MGRSRWLKCRWTGSTHNCPGVLPMWSLKPQKKPRRPSNTWTEVGEHIYTNTCLLRSLWTRVLSFFPLPPSPWLLSGQIDGQEITALAVLPQRIRRPPRRLSPPRRMPPPPPMWRRTPPRMRRRSVFEPDLLLDQTVVSDHQDHFPEAKCSIRVVLIKSLTGKFIEWPTRIRVDAAFLGCNLQIN